MTEYPGELHGVRLDRDGETLAPRPSPDRRRPIEDGARSDGRPAGIAVEFSLALNNRTGKYFMCKDVIDAQPLVDSRVRYWRRRSRTVPQKLTARVLGRLMSREVDWRARWPAFDRWLPRMRPRSAVLFTDPLQVSLYDLRGDDVVICHDMGPLTHPQYYAPGVKELYARIYAQVRAAKPHMVFVTRSSQLEFERLYGPAYRTADVVPCSIRAESFAGEGTAVERIGGPFLLMVGAVGARKNQAGVIQAFARARLADRGVKLVVVGGPEPGFDDVVAVARDQPGVIMMGYASAAELRWLYRNALGFVLASHLEGFGMPVAEAFLQGLVPVVSAGGALEEVAGPNAVPVDPDDVASIGAGLVTLVEMPAEERRRRVDLAQAHLATYSEAATRERWSEVLGRVLGESDNSGRV